MEIVNGNYLQTLVVMLEQHINSQNERFEIQTNQLGLIASLLGTLSINVCNIDNTQTELFKLVQDLQNKINSTIIVCDKISKVVPQCNPTPTLIDGVYVEPSGKISYNIPKGTIYNWGGWNIVK